MATESGGTAKPLPGLAAVLNSVGGVVGAVTIAALLWDCVAPPVPGGTQASQEGQSIGFSIGTIIRTLILGAVAGGLLMKARAVANPGRFGAAAVIRDELAAIAAALRERTVQEPTGAAGFYAQYSDADLVSVYQHIRPDIAPQRFAELVLEIRRRSMTPA